MSSSKKNKSAGKKPSTGRPISTAPISQPQVEDSSNQSSLSSFSPETDLFALLSLAIDKHRLRIYNTSTNQLVAEYVVESARVTSLTWGTLNLQTNATELTQPSTKKRRKQRNTSIQASVTDQDIHSVILGLSNGTILVFSPSHGCVIRTLGHTSSTTPVLTVLLLDTGTPRIWASSADRVIRVWDAEKNDIISSWKNEEQIPYSFLALRPALLGAEERNILAAHHGIKLLSLDVKELELASTPPRFSASFTGHASPVKLLKWDISQRPPHRFYSLAEGDRFLYVWEVPNEGSREGRPIASIPLDSAATTFTLFQPRFAHGSRALATLSTSGKVLVFSIPTEISPQGNSPRAEHKIPTLLPRSQISTLSKNGLPAAKIVNVSTAPERDGYLRISRLLNGVRPVFDIIRYLDDSGDFIPDIVIEDENISLNEDAEQIIANRRYSENATLPVESGVEIGQPETLEGENIQSFDGNLDVDIAELSLGQRLTAVSGEDALLSDSDRNDSNTAVKPTKSKKKTRSEIVAAPANSLTRTLIQALHSSDSRLLETCLAHSDPALISNTVRRIPPQLAVPLISACAERLGRGSRSANMKGRGGGASSQRGSSLVIWIRTVLAMHSGHLMTIPDLVSRLSGLHTTIASRLALQDSLLSLSGRLELVLSQMQMRSSTTPTPLNPKHEKTLKSSVAEVTKYVEGESGGSDSEDEFMNVEDNAFDSGSVEDVELGGSEGGASDESEESDEEIEDEDDSEEPTVNGFIDDEAEEYSEEDETDSE
ncbi:hypothetical protein AX17_000754 [Amanita inopinata Kibby_2008]|nr:hypothetical protein AX17_000754 [Amanita inopinata Kibby_2008]